MRLSSRRKSTNARPTWSIRSAIWKVSATRSLTIYARRSGISSAYVEELEAEPIVKDSGVADLLQRMKTATHRMNALIVDLLNYSRVGRQEIRIQPVNLDSMVDDIVKQHAELSEPGLLVVHHPLDTVLAEPTMLQQCMVNLLENARKFVRPGTQPKIEIWKEKARVQSAIDAAGSGLIFNSPQHLPPSALNDLPERSIDRHRSPHAHTVPRGHMSAFASPTTASESTRNFNKRSLAFSNAPAIRRSSKARALAWPSSQKLFKGWAASAGLNQRRIAAAVFGWSFLHLNNQKSNYTFNLVPGTHGKRSAR